jgi:hypothetical protein
MRTYTETEKADYIAKVFELIATMTTNVACKKLGIPVGTFRGWVAADDGMAKQYALARSLYHDQLAAEILEISDEAVGETANGGSDNGAVQRNRLRVDSRKWLLSKLAPKRYGDRLQLAGDEDNPVAVKVVKRVIIGPKGDDETPEQKH